MWRSAGYLRHEPDRRCGLFDRMHGGIQSLTPFVDRSFALPAKLPDPRHSSRWQLVSIRGVRHRRFDPGSGIDIIKRQLDWITSFVLLSLASYPPLCGKLLDPDAPQNGRMALPKDRSV
jgi:hypothetical protein